jgi:membrane protein YqaA with SNARE-associated domain
LFRQFLAYLESLGVWGVLALTFIDSAGIPVTVGLDAYLIFLCVRQPESALLVTVAAVLGSAAGNIVLYALARRGGQRFLEKRDQGGRIRKVEHWFHRYGMLTVFVPALVPIPMPLKAFVILTGVFGVRPAVFLATIFLARILRYGGEAWLGVQMGAGAADYLRQHAGYLAGFAAALFAGLYAVAWLVERRRRG